MRKDWKCGSLDNKKNPSHHVQHKEIYEIVTELCLLIVLSEALILSSFMTHCWCFYCPYLTMGVLWSDNIALSVCCGGTVWLADTTSDILFYFSGNKGILGRSSKNKATCQRDMQSTFFFHYSFRSENDNRGVLQKLKRKWTNNEIAHTHGVRTDYPYNWSYLNVIKDIPKM